MADVTIKVYANGPMKVTGPITILDAEDQEYAIADGVSAVLCRCGHSSNKPFCDATHKRVGFVADDTAPRVEQVEQV
jgi:CDGSH-type Zn-finger protein